MKEITKMKMIEKENTLKTDETMQRESANGHG